eukprot:CAMPEP_0179260356 /NCGR_PEP_ID=MMETSP0797-20121207/26297_1 /TAXON_ID=47934 /ORGANISM="Dinophysis acuminata, Strain DAEP01" /LENGTH=314 /DNA_ID=CAMNT_0020968433 /DNA_START=218 /DNA_END=1159 /DNA_ORIENTATION=-
MKDQPYVPPRQVSEPAQKLGAVVDEVQDPVLELHHAEQPFPGDLQQVEIYQAGVRADGQAQEVDQERGPGAPPRQHGVHAVDRVEQVRAQAPQHVLEVADLLPHRLRDEPVREVGELHPGHRPGGVHEVLRAVVVLDPDRLARGPGRLQHHGLAVPVDVHQVPGLELPVAHVGEAPALQRLAELPEADLRAGAAEAARGEAPEPLVVDHLALQVVLHHPPEVPLHDGRAPPPRHKLQALLGEGRVHAADGHRLPGPLEGEQHVQQHEEQRHHEPPARGLDVHAHERRQYGRREREAPPLQDVADEVHGVAERAV